MSKLKVSFGIDFGTTNSATVSIVEGRRIYQYGDERGNPLPSIVVIDRATGETFYGRTAWERRRELSQSYEVITSVKGYLGTDRVWQIAGQNWTPEMVAAQIFRGLKNQVEKKSDSNLILDEAVVAIPVGFSPEKRQSLRKAANMAGIKISSFISESTAAFFKHYENLKHYSKLAIFDWGGGTLDVSIIENKKGKINELAVSGLKLGGDDLDLKLATWAHAKIMRQKNLNISFDEMPAESKDIMLVKAEIAKRNLSESDSAAIAINKYGDLEFVRTHIDIDTFCALVEPEVTKAINTLEEAVKKANLSFNEIECILMVGGSSNLKPLLESIGKKWADHNIEFHNGAEWSIAKGAAMLSLNPGCFRLNQDIGVILSDGSFFPILTKDCVIPLEQCTFNFGIIEETTNARFIFSDNEFSYQKNHANILGYLSVPTYGFFKEQLELKAKIDDDLVFYAEVKSDKRPEQYTAIWNHTDLKFYYELSDLKRLQL